MPFSIRIERAMDRPDTQNIMWGPILQQLLGTPAGAAGSYWNISLYSALKLDGNYSRAAIVQTATTASDDPLFTIQASDSTNSTTTMLIARPYYISDEAATSSYFRRAEPAVVFGSVDTGVANLKRDDSLPLYDVPVADVASPGRDGLTFLDVVWDQAPFATHEGFVECVAAVADEFVAAGVYTAAERDVIVAKAGEAEAELAL